MPTDEPIIIYMKFIYIGDKIIRNRDDKKYGVCSQENHGRFPGRLDPGYIIRSLLK